MPPKKPPIRKETNPNNAKPLTNAQYEEIFDAVINKPAQQHLPNLKSPLVGKSPKISAFSPKECASLENSQNTSSQKQDTMKKEKARKISRSKKSTTELVVSLNKPKPVYSESSNNQSESISTVHSEDFRKNAVFSTPVIKEAATTETTIKKKQKSFREAVKTLKDSESQLSETLLGSLTQAQTSLNNSLLTDVPLSQPPENLNHRERLLWLKARRGENVFVQCDRCDKWRMSDVQDPVDLPKMWYCQMNKDKNFNNCSIPEQKLSIYVEADLIMNQYTAGTLVWAKIFGYPWWPAMVDDDPDTEQYYWIEDYDLNIPTHYHVTFFDGKREKATRAWINTTNLKSFKHNLDLDKNVSIKYKGRIRFGKEQALDAMKLPIKERLNEYCFISKTRHRINTPVGTPAQSDADDEADDSRNSKTRKINKRRCTVDDPAAQLKKLFLQNKDETQAEDKKQEVTKKVTKRRKTIGYVNELLEKKSSDFNRQNSDESNKTLNVENLEKEKRIQKRRNSIPERCSQRDSSQDSNEPKKITRRRNTRLDTSIERDSSFSQDSNRQKRVTKRRSTIAVSSKDIEDSNKVEKDQKKKIIPRRRKSILERNLQRDSSQDLDEPKKITSRRNTRANTSIEPDSSFSQDSSKGKKITKRRKTIADYGSQTSKGSQNTVIEQDSIKLEEEDPKEKKAPRRRKSMFEKHPQRDSSQDLDEPKKITTRRNTRENASTDRDFSQDSNRDKKITKRRSTISVYESQTSKDSQNTVIRQEPIKLEKDQKETRTPRRNSIIERHSQRDSSQDLVEPKKITRRRSTHVNAMDRDFSQDSNREKKITKRRSTISVYESQTSKDPQNTVIGQEPIKLEKDQKENRTPRRRNSIFERHSQRDSSQDLVEPKKNSRRSFSQDLNKDMNENGPSKSIENGNKNNKIQKRRVSIPERNSSQNSNRSKKDNKLDTSIERENSFSEGSTKLNKTTLGKHDPQNSDNFQKSVKSNKLEIKKERDSSANSNVSAKISTRRNTVSSQESQKNENKENKIKRRRNTIRETNSQRSSSQNSDEPHKIAKRRNTLGGTNTEKEKNVTNVSLTTSQKSDESRKNAKRRNTRLESNIEKENTSSQGSQKEKKITKRRTTIAEYNYQQFNEEETQKTNMNTRNSQENKINRRRKTIETDANFMESSIRSDGSTKINNQRSKFVCPKVATNSSVSLEEKRSNESQNEPKKYRKTLGARKILSSNAPKNIKGTESGYESAMSTKKEEENKQNLSIILEESKLDIANKSSYEKIGKYHIPKKRRQTTDGQEKKIDETKRCDDEELEITFTSLSQSLEQLDVEKRKKKFMAICKEIVNEDSADPTISEEEKMFYEKLNNSLKQVEEEQDRSIDESLAEKVKAFETKLGEIENNNNKSPFFKSINTSFVSSNTSMQSDFSDIGTKTMKKSSKKRSSSDDRQLKKKITHNSSVDSVDSLPFEI